jgi:hypothetical protein
MSWRDTLFVWQGQWTQRRSQDNNNAAATIEWKGTWVGCEECPDGRSAGTPNMAAFSNSEMAFDVNGEVTATRTGDDEMYQIVELTSGPGWDLGDGDDKQKHRDSTHQIYMVTNTEDTNLDRPLIVATGVNDFGPFISAGYFERSTSNLILARRYLDAGDRRSKWTVQELFERIKETDGGSFVIVDYEKLWQQTHASLRIAPWRTIEMHAKKKLPAKVKEPTLKNPTTNWDPSLRIVSTPNSIQLFSPNIVWLEQCWGCGNPIKGLMSAQRRSPSICCKEIKVTFRSSTSFTCAFYCEPDCIRKFGIQPWVALAKDMLINIGTVISSNGEMSFWKAIESGGKRTAEDVSVHSKSLQDSGWKQLEHECILQF